MKSAHACRLSPAPRIVSCAYEKLNRGIWRSHSLFRRERDWSLSHRRPLTVAGDAGTLRQTIKRGESFLAPAATRALEGESASHYLVMPDRPTPARCRAPCRRPRRRRLKPVASARRVLGFWSFRGFWLLACERRDGPLSCQGLQPLSSRARDPQGSSRWPQPPWRRSRGRGRADGHPAPIARLSDFQSSTSGPRAN